MKTKLLALSALALVGLGSGVVGLSQVHAQSATTTPAISVQQTTSKVAPNKEVPDANETSGAVESATEKPDTNGVDADGPGGHQDPNGVEVPDQGGQ